MYQAIGVGVGKFGKILLGVLGVGGSFTVFLDQLLDGAIREGIKMHPAAYEIISYLFIVLFALYIISFGVDRYLNFKERSLGMKEKKVEIEKDKEELYDMKKGNSIKE